MSPTDNTSAHASDDYASEVKKTIPCHAQMIDLAIEVGFAAVPGATRWLDTGCGPGALVAEARRFAPDLAFVLADPSAAMLALARAKNPQIPAENFLQAPSDALPELPRFDVITAVQSHHYYADPSGRERALLRCFNLLRPGGALLVFENVRAETELGHALQRRRWAAFQHAQGREQATVDLHLAREGTKFFPLRESEHLALLTRVGFTTVETIWRAHAQAGFLALAPI
ncbi:MAG: class I SAM-dependent methyltransferase [Byssovorax sp.]